MCLNSTLLGGLSIAGGPELADAVALVLLRAVLNVRAVELRSHGLLLFA